MAEIEKKVRKMTTRKRKKVEEPKEIKTAAVPTTSIDDDMPEPLTKDYSNKSEEPVAEDKPTPAPGKKFVPMIFVKQSFQEALFSTLGTLGYDRKIGTPDSFVTVGKVFETVASVIGKPITEKSANLLLGWILHAPYNVIHGIADVIRKDQSVYFDVMNVEVDESFDPNA